MNLPVSRFTSALRYRAAGDGALRPGLTHCVNALARSAPTARATAPGALVGGGAARHRRAND